MSFMQGLKDKAKAAMSGKLGGFIRRADGGTVPAPKAGGKKAYAVGGAVDMGGVGGAPARTNLGRPGRGRPKGSKNKGKKGKGKGTNVNVVVMPKPDQAPAAAVPPPPILPPVAPPPMPMAGPPPGAMPPPPGPMPGAGMPPPDLGLAGGPAGMMPPMRAAGGRIPADQDEGGAGSGVGRLQKVADSDVKPGKAASA